MNGTPLRAGALGNRGLAADRDERGERYRHGDGQRQHAFGHRGRCHDGDRDRDEGP
ncbi:MAG: hypothetical protein IPF51_10600 [Dehalococcoidia bacterium]|uniref:hypothetical protein n=1 Tax=Candidatus Amarobacter glycogenicus TaxID=3140699 RepID=UPI0031352987|nr:hypothetical protein [Dehalococcoidia bacterium]